MKSRRNVLLINALLLPLILIHFQNCSSAGAPGAHSGNSGGGTISLGGVNGKTALQFVQDQVQFKDDTTSTGVDGFCNAQVDGTSLRWVLWGGADQSSPVAGGDAHCEQGNFTVAMADLSQFTCGVSQLLTIEGADGSSTYAHLTRLCQPLSSKTIAAPSSAPAGTSCDLEYSAASIADHTCAQVCYRDSKVVSMVDVDVNQCAGMARGLASGTASN